jgi:hypothetical protein
MLTSSHAPLICGNLALASSYRPSRVNRTASAAEIYESIHATRRAPRARQLATLYQAAERTVGQEQADARYNLAEFISAHPDGIYFNDAFWGGYQRYALQASSDGRLTGSERKTFVDDERTLKDQQEEYWRAYLILRDVVRSAPRREPRRKAALLAVRCLRKISDCFGRQEDLRQAEQKMSAALRADNRP